MNVAYSIYRLTHPWNPREEGEFVARCDSYDDARSMLESMGAPDPELGYAIRSESRHAPSPTAPEESNFLAVLQRHLRQLRSRHHA